MTKPTYIALCGKPTAGKDTVAKIIAARTDAAIIDDGLVLRQAAPILFNFNPAYPFSQEGKLKEIIMPDGHTRRSVRDCLGKLGDLIEQEFGADIMPARAVELADRVQKSEGVSTFVFPSVRKQQGWYYKKRGGLVVEINRNVPESRYAFDRYDVGAVDYVIDNTGTLEDLHDEVSAFLAFLKKQTLNV